MHSSATKPKQGLSVKATVDPHAAKGLKAEEAPSAQDPRGQDPFSPDEFQATDRYRLSRSYALPKERSQADS